jgi:hypothetical protein
MSRNRSSITYAEVSEDEVDYMESSYSQETDFAEPQEVVEFDSDEEVDLEYTGDPEMDSHAALLAYYSGDELEDSGDGDFLATSSWKSNPNNTETAKNYDNYPPSDDETTPKASDKGKRKPQKAKKRLYCTLI